jgi:DNA processing protein
MNAREAYIALNMIDEVGPVRVRALLDRFQSPETVLAAGPSDLKQVEGIGPEVARNISRWREKIDLDGELARIEKAGVRVVTRDDADYPKNLRQIYDPPLVLYVRGTMAEDPLSIAIVGSRRTTLYGQETARKLSYQLARVGVAVVSGGARGVDTCAHTGALQAKGRTVCVIGCGIDVVYPAENKKLFDDIAEKGGAVVSEFPFGVQPDRQHFPMRNRIVSGWSVGLVVVEAALNSGALITANFAAEQGRHVFAVPGRVDSPPSRGCHKLIKEGAKLTEDVEDIMAELEYLIPPDRRSRMTVKEDGGDDAVAGDEGQLQFAGLKLTEPEGKILAAIGTDEAGVDGIIRQTGLTSATVFATLLTLEMKRLVRQRPGRMYVVSRPGSTTNQA